MAGQAKNTSRDGMPGCTALLLILISTSRNLKGYCKGFLPQKFNLNFHFLTIVLQLQNFPCCTYEFHSFSASSFQITFTQNQTILNYSEKLSSIRFQMCKSAKFIRRKAEPKYHHPAMPYKSPSIRTRQNHCIGFCNPVSVPFIACR